MIYRKLDENGDMIMGRGTATFIQSSEAVGQAIKTRLLLWQGEWWEDLEEGLPMMQRILGFRNTQQAADILIRERILGTENVLNIISFDSSYDGDTRSYSYQSEVATAFGNIVISEAF